MRVIEKQTLMRLANEYAYSDIPREVLDFWIKGYGRNVEVDSQADSHSAPPSNGDGESIPDSNENSVGAQSKKDNLDDSKEEKS